jgi:septal ring factor EnvC (AmiA/AmiB activator)
MFDHGAAQAASRLLPLLAGGGPATAAPKASADEEAGLALLASLEKERNAIRADLDLCKEQLRSHEERLVKLREALTRTLADHDGMQRSLKQLNDRNRLLTAGVVILLMLMVAGAVLFEVNVHHG